MLRKRIKGRGRVPGWRCGLWSLSFLPILGVPEGAIPFTNLCASHIICPVLCISTQFRASCPYCFSSQTRGCFHSATFTACFIFFTRFFRSKTKKTSYERLSDGIRVDVSNKRCVYVTIAGHSTYFFDSMAQRKVEIKSLLF